MRILEVTDFYYPWIAGPAPFIKSLSAGLVERGHDVTIACPSPTGPPYDESDPPRRHRVRTVPVPFGYRLRAGLPLLDLTRLTRAWRPDVIHFHHPFPISVAALLAAKSQRVPLVATNHTVPECTLFGIRSTRLYRPAETILAAQIRFVLGRAAAVTTPTATAARMLHDLGFKGPVEPISNGVDTTRFRPSAASSNEGEPPTILYTGRLDDDKDLETLIRALPRVLKSVAVNVRIGGEGTDRTRLEGMVADMGLSRQVRFTGYVSDEELPRVYQESALFCIPSQVELQSISTLEAMACGLPIVAADAGALPELVKPTVNGHLVPPGDPEAFADAIVDVLTNHARRHLFGTASRSIAEQHSVTEMISKYERLLQEVASGVAVGSSHGTAGG